MISEKLEERLAKLAGGVAVIKVGAATETEMKAKSQKLRMQEMRLLRLKKKELFKVVELL